MPEENTGDQRPKKKNNEKTTAQVIAHGLSADHKEFHIRKIADFVILLAGLWLIVSHSDHDHGVDWQAWALIAIGGGDLGIQSIGGILNSYLKK